MQYKYEDLLAEYQAKLKYADRMMEKNSLSFFNQKRDFWEGYKFASNCWFEENKLFCEDFEPRIKEPTPDQADRFGHYLDRENNRKYDLEGVLCYREMLIPVYGDDDGQQMFAVYEGHIIAGGSYNAHPEFDFCYQIDQYLDKIKF